MEIGTLPGLVEASFVVPSAIFAWYFPQLWVDSFFLINFLLKDTCFTEFLLLFVKPQHESAMKVKVKVKSLSCV